MLDTAKVGFHHHSQYDKPKAAIPSLPLSSAPHTVGFLLQVLHEPPSRFPVDPARQKRGRRNIEKDLVMASYNETQGRY